MISTRHVTVGTTPVKLLGGTRGGAMVKFSADVFIGGSDLTVANGFPVSAGEAPSVDTAGDDALYAVTASGTATAYVFTNKGV